MKMVRAGWVWEGTGFDPGVLPTVYGVGEGVRYFGVPGATFIFHPNNRTNLAKLSHAEAVVADISKWVWYETKAENGRFTFAQRRGDNPETAAEEGEKLSALALEFPNIRGAFIDDTHWVSKHPAFTEDNPRKIKEAVQRRKSSLDLRIVAYTHELEQDWLDCWKDSVDVISLWVADSSELPKTKEYVERCRMVFQKQKIEMGIYLRDYSKRRPVALDLLECELDAIRGLLASGDLAGYDILGACLIDQHPEQAGLIRSYIKDH